MIKLINYITRSVTLISLFCLILLNFTAVFYRYVLSTPLIWVEEISILLFSIVTFYGISIAYDMDQHAKISIVYDLFSERIQKIIDIVGSVCTCIIACYIGYLMCKLGLSSKFKVTAILQIPYLYIDILLSLPIFFIAIKQVSIAYSLFKFSFRGEQ